jgi:regulatory protein
MDLKKAIYHYCSYQERCHAEVRNKLYELGCTTPEVEENIALLIETGILNEERYARAFARGKFRMKHWGKQKIISQLKLHKISDYCIKKGLTEIDEAEYADVLLKLAETKWAELKKDKNIYTRKSKVYRYLAQKGYSSSEITETIAIILNASN